MSYSETPAAIAGGSSGSNAFIDAQDGSITDPLAGAGKLSEYDALLLEHSDFLANIEKWNKFTDCYEAKDIYKYVFKHTRESDDIWQKRVKRGYYFNYVASVVDLFVAYLFHSPIERKFGELTDSEDLQSIKSNADKHGNTFDLFIQMVSVFAQIHGHCGILVDMPRTPTDGIQSEEERKKLNFRPYFTLLQASQFKDWELDEYDQFEWVKLEIKRPEDRSWREASSRGLRNFLIWTKTSWEEWQVTENQQEDPKLIGSGSHDLGRVPIVIARNEKCLCHEWMGLSSVRDIADINIAILNWSSLGDEEIYERCLNILAIERSELDARVDLSHNNALEFEPGATPPFYLTPGTSPLDLIAKWIECGRDEIYRLAKMGGASGIKGQQSSLSGIAYAYEFNETNQSLARKAESLEQAETEIWRLVAAWMKVGTKDLQITYPKEFGVEDFLTEFQILSEARANLTSETAIKEIEKRVVSKMFAREQQELREKIKREIDSGRGVPSPGIIEAFSQEIPASLYGTAKRLPSQDLAREQMEQQSLKPASGGESK